jgi:hypothetical protein
MAPPRYSDLVDLLPWRLKGRFESLGSYVDAVLHEHEEKIPKQRQLKNEDIQVIKLAVFIYALQDFFREGTRAAARAVDVFQALGVPGFTVGSSLFEGRNENVVRGDRLAQALWQAIGDTEILSIRLHV